MNYLYNFLCGRRRYPSSTDIWNLSPTYVTANAMLLDLHNVTLDFTVMPPVLVGEKEDVAKARVSKEFQLLVGEIVTTLSGRNLT